MDKFYEEFRHGSAAWADEAALARAGLFKRDGSMLGFSDRAPLFLGGDSPQITIAGAGGGKLRDLIAYILCGIRGPYYGWYAPRRILITDPRGELAAISIHNQVRLGKAAYCFNAFRLHGLIHHRVNPWDVICPKSLTFHADVKLVVHDLITSSGSANSEYFEARAREWVEGLIKHVVLESGGITMAALYGLINKIEDPSGWNHLAESMLHSPLDDIPRIAAEMDTKRAEAPKEYGAILGEIHKALNFLSDPLLRDALSGSDFSMRALCEEDCNVYLIIPAEYMSLLAPMLRALIGAAMIYKQRAPSAPRVLFLIDEAAQLGRFESLLRAYSYGRGMGLRTWSFWQDVGQLSRNYGRDAVSGFLGSSQLRQFFGVRDLDTAKMVSAMLGTQTLEYDSELQQMAAKRNRAQIIRSLLDGADPFAAGLNFEHQDRAARNRTKAPRPLLTPDEILSMPEDRQILLISGLGLHPVFAAKRPYFDQRAMAGGFMPNPYHPPTDKVRVMTRLGRRWAPVITERVPGRYAHLPQYQDGEWKYIKGYRP